MTGHLRSLALATAAVAAAAGAGLLGAPAAQAASTLHGCPAGWVCIYPNASWNGDRPSLKFFTYGNHNLSNQFGVKRLLNNQTGGAWDFECSGYNGTGSTLNGGTAVSWADLNFTPVNSVRLTAAYSPCSG